jgi:hypothetical protein
MATNSFFSNYNFVNEQQLIDDLVVESIQIFGVDTFYVTRDLREFDEIMNEDALSVFNAAYQMEVYIKGVDGFEGEGDFLSKFGLQIRDQATFTVAIRTFERYATRLNPQLVRPKEGDLVYMPMNKKFFKIMHVEHESVFYQTGALQVYDLKTELFEYSNERFQTGIEEIDTHYRQFQTDDVEDLEALFNVDPIAKNIFYEEKKNDIIDFSESDPFQEIISRPSNFIPSTDSTDFTSDNDKYTSDTG